MRVEDFTKQIAINNDLTRQTLSALANDGIDWSGPISLKETLTALRSDIIINGVSHSDVTQLKAIEALNSITNLLDERMYSSERTYVGLQRVILVINNALTLL